MYENTGGVLPEGSLKPRVVLKSNSKYGQQDLRSQDARSSWDPPSDSKSHGENWNNAVDYRIPGLPLSTVEQHDTTRENKAKKLIEKFEKHQHKESFFLSQTQKINQSSKESQELIADLNNTEIFELCENSSKQQCPDSNAYWEIGKIFCSCGRNMKSLRSPTEFDQNNRDVTSIPGYAIEKNRKRGVQHGFLKDRRCTTRRNRCLKKPDRENNDTIQRYFHDGTPAKSTGLCCR